MAKCKSCGQEFTQHDIPYCSDQCWVDDGCPTCPTPPSKLPYQIPTTPPDDHPFGCLILGLLVLALVGGVLKWWLGP